MPLAWSILLALTLPNSNWGQELRSCPTKSDPPYSYRSNAVYDGFDSIFIIGDDTNSRWNLTDDSWVHLGNFYKSGTLVASRSGDVIYLGGSYSPSLTSFDVNYFKRGKTDYRVVGKLAGDTHSDSSGVIIEDVVYLFGGVGDYYSSTIQEYNLTSNHGRVVGNLPHAVHRSAAINDGIYVYIFGGNTAINGGRNEILQFDPATFQVTTLKTKLPAPSGNLAAVLVDKVVYLFQHYKHGKDILMFHTQTKEVSVFKEKLNFEDPSAVYVEQQRRIYIFEANKRPVCIDFPPAFDCTGQPDGNYPYPSDCAKFFTCSNEHAYEMNCPDGLHFDPIHLLCNYPNIANCVVY